MNQLKPALKILSSKKFLQSAFAYVLLMIFLYFLKDFILIFFLTFIFSFLFYSFGEFLKGKIDHLIDKYHLNKKVKNIKKILHLNVIITLQYLLFIGMILFTITDFLPKLVSELSRLPETFPFMSEQIRILVEKLNEVLTFNTQLEGGISELLSSEDINAIVSVLQDFKTVGAVIFQFLLAVFLSYIFIIDRKRLFNYLDKIKHSNFSFLYDAYNVVFEKVIRSFGLLFKAQAIVASANAGLTTVGLYILGLFYPDGFPYLITLGLLVFIFAFIPVFGTILSSIPIMLIAFTLGGIVTVFEVLVLIAIVHVIEAYYLNPKIVSSLMEMPISVTFLILIISEHLFGMIGLIVGVSMFYFISELFGDFDKKISKTHKKLSKAKEKKES